MLSFMSDIDIIIRAHDRDLGGFTVGRALPTIARRTLGPVVFFDHIGPLDLPVGQGVDVRPHPHIHLATVTYLFEGELVHRDSLGTLQPIRPGELNWMNAGRGIVHSERSSPEARACGVRLHGLQLWVGLPRRDEDSEPGFQHHGAEALPVVSRPGADIRVVAGSAFGASAPVRLCSPFTYLGIALEADAELALPDEHPERGLYVVSGRVSCDGADHEPRRLLFFKPGGHPVVRARVASRLVWLAGAPLDGPRHLFWNFVSSSPERIEQAKRDWNEGRFPLVPGDEHERIPLPE
jgi:redox-sensitive bicupin YhaK (pirin superfamily)